MAKISAAEINSIRLKEQGSNPSAPASTYGQLFVKSDGVYFINAAGTVTGPLAAAGASLGADGWAAADAMTYASADAPTFTVTVAGDQTGKYWPGMRIKLTQTTAKYFLITAVAYTSATTITLYGGTDYTLANAAITSPYYSSAKAPLGFPLDPVKWTVESTYTSDTYAQPGANVWTNLGTFTISVPIGLWQLGYMVTNYTNGGDLKTTLSTANNSESNGRLTSYGVGSASFTKWDIVTIAAKTTYYLNTAKTLATGEIDIFGARANPCRIFAVCAYL